MARLSATARTGSAPRWALAVGAALGFLFVGLAAVGPADASHTENSLTETLVTGHTTLASNYAWVDGPAPAASSELYNNAAGGGGTENSGRSRNECVVWFNGATIFDGTLTPGNSGGDFWSLNDNALDPCGVIFSGLLGNTKPTDFAAVSGAILGSGLVIAVESGDCDPRDAAAAEFVRDLSFTDPNGVDHAVAELRYTCFYAGLLEQLVEIAEGELGTSVPGDVPDSPRNRDDEPMLGDGQNPFPDGLGVLNETFVEYAWVTATHVIVVDPTLDDAICLTPVVDGEGNDAGVEDFCIYNYALMVDTCNAEPTVGSNARSARNRCTDGGGEEFPSDDSFRGPRFDDTRREFTAHAACAANYDEIREGNSRNNPGNYWESDCADDHREDKTADSVVGWGYATETDFDGEEDHLTAKVDLYVSGEECSYPQTAVGFAFCTYGWGYIPLLVNHPGCWNPDHDAMIGDGCWNPMLPADDSPGAG